MSCDKIQTVTFAEAADRKQCKLLGRTMIQNGVLCCDWSASGVEFNLECEDDITIEVTPLRETDIGIYVDNEFHMLKTGKEKCSLVIATGLKYGLHNIKIIKSTGISKLNTAFLLALNSMTFKGTVAAPPASMSRFIEFVGDSITVGYGVYEEGAEPSVRDYAIHSHAYLTAKSLDADYSIIAVNGTGAVKSNNKAIMPEIYEYTCWHRDNTVLYDFPRKADLVVINLGTNDFGRGAEADVYETALEAFTKVVLEKHNRPKIVYPYGVMNSAFEEERIRVANRFGGSENGFFTLRLPEGRSGAAHHPNVAEQAAAAKVLSEFIKTTVFKSE